jgi:hypothetical protein
MFHKYAITLGLALAMLGVVFMPGLVPVTRGQSNETSVTTAVVATVITVDANTNMATLRTEGGEIFELLNSPRWYVGHKVICNRIGDAQLRFQNCRLWESAHPITSPAQGQPVPRR